MRFKHFIALGFAAAVVSACQQQDALNISRIEGKADYRLSNTTIRRMKALDMKRDAPIMIRIFKEEGIMEVWKEKTTGRYALLKSYQICAWSGMLGPKTKEGDRQAPEGFYEIAQGQMNPNSRYYLSFNIGYPNIYDRSLGRTGSNLMVHGACSSAGCYSMTDSQVQEIFALAHDAFQGGQRAFQVEAFPFRMTADNMAKHQNNQNFNFWKMLKVGYDNFEITHRPPEVEICNHTYVFNQVSTDGRPFSPYNKCPAMSTPPALTQAYAAYEAKYDKEFAQAEKKYAGYVWDEPTEAQRKAVVANLKKKSSDIAFAPTGSGLQAGRMVPIAVYRAEKEHKAEVKEAKKLTKEAIRAADKARTASVPVPKANPEAGQETARNETGNKKPFWMFWAK